MWRIALFLAIGSSCRESLSKMKARRNINENERRIVAAKRLAARNESGWRQPVGWQYLWQPAKANTANLIGLAA
jgi:hypothetical protein